MSTQTASTMKSKIAGKASTRETTRMHHSLWAVLVVVLCVVVGYQQRQQSMVVERTLVERQAMRARLDSMELNYALCQQELLDHTVATRYSAQSARSSNFAGHHYSSSQLNNPLDAPAWEQPPQRRGLAQVDDIDNHGAQDDSADLAMAAQQQVTESARAAAKMFGVLTAQAPAAPVSPVTLASTSSSRTSASASIHSGSMDNSGVRSDNGVAQRGRNVVSGSNAYAAEEEAKKDAERQKVATQEIRGPMTQQQIDLADPRTEFVSGGVAVELELETTTETSIETTTTNMDTGKVMSHVVEKTSTAKNSKSFDDSTPPSDPASTVAHSPALVRGRKPPPLDHGAPETIAEARARVAKAKLARQSDPRYIALEAARRERARESRDSDDDDEYADDEDEDDSDYDTAGGVGGRVRLVVDSKGQATAQLGGSTSRSKTRKGTSRAKSANAIEVPNVAWNEHVTAFDAASFDKALDDYDFVFVAFYAPWCEHCRRLKGELNAAAEGAVLKTMTENKASSKMRIAVGAVDCMSHRSLCSEVDSVPKLWLFRNRNAVKLKAQEVQKHIEYVGPREAGALAQWVVTSCHVLNFVAGLSGTAIPPGVSTGNMNGAMSLEKEMVPSRSPGPPAEVSASFWNLCAEEVGLHWLNRELPDNGATNSPALTQVRLIDPSEEVEMLTYAGHAFVAVSKGGAGSRLFTYMVSADTGRYVITGCDVAEVAAIAADEST